MFDSFKLMALLAAAIASSAVDVDIPGIGKVAGGSLNPALPDISWFVGIPYAKPPTGALRWQPPQAHAPWTDTFNATTMPNICLQPKQMMRLPSFWTQGQDPPPVPPQSEDCLSLHIAAPTAALNGKQKLPVMLWIHGGGYTVGSGIGFPQDALVNSTGNTMVVVSVNYRLNAFGFLASAEMSKRGLDKGSGNYGIQDQWAHEHISAFGGDPDDITIFGESAGGNSVINHLASAASAPYYTKAIIESGAYSAGAKTMAEAESQYQTALQNTSCHDIYCLVALDADTALTQIATRANSGRWTPTVDGKSLTKLPTDLIKAGEHNTKAPVMIGSNRDEASLVDAPGFEGGGLPANLTHLQFDALLLGAGLSAQELAALTKLYDPEAYPYPEDLGGYTHWWWALMRIQTDGVPGTGVCGARWVARLLAEGGTPAVYAYLFAHPTTGSPLVPPSPSPPVFVPHTAEILYVFADTAYLAPGEEADLARTMAGYWTNFAATGRPSPKAHDTNATAAAAATIRAGVPAWPEYEPASDQTQRLDVPSAGGIVPQAGLRKAACDFWDARNPFM